MGEHRPTVHARPGRRPRRATWAPPQEFEEYRLLRPLGRGGMGEVYLAHDTLLDRLVAIKFLSEVYSDEDRRDRFLVEARAAARLHHPNVVVVHRVGEIAGRPYLVSEFVRGRSLARVSKPISWRRALDYGIDLARGLAAAHRGGVLHRDIKPGNAIVAASGEVKLLDFGLAKLVGPDAGAPGQERLVASEAPARGGGRAPATDEDDGEPTEVRPSEAPSGALGPESPGGSRWRDDLTGAGTIMGTPRYMAPEVSRGEPATYRADVYALGVVLYELCSGRVPRGERDRDAGNRPAGEAGAPRPLADVAPEVDPRLAEIVETCLRADPEKRYASGEELRAALERIAHTEAPQPIPAGNPYRGLCRFEAEHRGLFFGRDAEVRSVIERLRVQRVVVVTGDSGVGKSSLCRAGVLPAIAEDVLGEARTWQYTTVVAGARPLTALRTALELPVDEVGTDEIGDLVRTLGERLRGTGLVIFLDQLEEMITVADPDEAARAIQILVRLAVGVPHVRLLATLRCDFLTAVADLPEMADEIGRGLFLLRPLSQSGTHEAIVGPARAKGTRFESEELVDELVASVARRGGALPLLQFALAEMWQARDHEANVITETTLREMGGPSGALARHADGVLAELLPAERRAARTVLLRLVGSDGTRRRRGKHELVAEGDVYDAALAALIRGRLIVVGDDEGRPTYELAHEALLSHWDTLKAWQAEEEDVQAVKARLEGAAREWARLGRRRDALWNRVQLREARHIDRRELPRTEADFLAASKRAARRKRWSRNLLIATIPLVVIGGYGWFRFSAAAAVQENATARIEASSEILSEALAGRGELDRALDDAYAAFDAGRDREAEALWDRSRTLAAEVRADLSAASRHLEAALAFDPRNARARAQLARLLSEQARLARLQNEPERTRELLQRLRLYDDQAAREWNTPAHATISSPTPGMTVTLYRYVEKDEYRRPRRLTGQAPPLSKRLEPGSYLAIGHAPDHVTVRHPFMMRRGETLRLELDPPAASDVPPGYAYVPAGEVLFGSAADDSLRRGFFSAVPIHPRHTGAFLIAIHESTYADWIGFLEALPRAERQRRTPRTTSGFHGSLELERRGERWRLVMQPGNIAIAAAEGEPFVYPTREQRSAQDWLRFPVTGISWNDAIAYTEWLDRSGRVPGARPCTELEWERAARGADGREFPHGDRIEPQDANFDVTYGRDPLAFGPDEVGSHPRSRSPFGLHDMAGNAWEQTSSVRAEDEVVARGGSWFLDQVVLHIPNREVIDPTMRNPTLGFRVCADPP